MAKITDLIQRGTEDLETFLRAYEFELDQRRAAERANRPTLRLANDDEDDAEARAWARQLHSTRACRQTKI